VAAAQLARVGEAKAAYYPQLAAHAGFWRDEAVALHDYSATTTRSSTIKDGDDYSAALSLGIVLLDFVRRSGTVAANELQLEAARLDVEATQADLELAVRTAFFDTLKMRRAREVQAATVKQYEEHFAQAQAFYEAGTKPRYDVTKAEVDVSNVKLALGDVDNALRVAWVNLATLVGFDSGGEPLIAETPAPPIAPTTSADAAATAYASRPELAAARKLADAAERSLAVAKADFYPYLTGAATYTWDGPELPVDRGWGAGIRVDWSIFSGFATRQRVAQANAEAEAARATVESVRRRITREVESQYLEMQHAEAKIADAEKGVRLAQENLDLANLRYRSGVGSPVEVTDALVSESRAELAHVEALYDYRIAVARLDRAMGRRHSSGSGS
jgi:outer membrane protein